MIPFPVIIYKSPLEANLSQKLNPLRAMKTFITMKMGHTT